MNTMKEMLEKHTIEKITVDMILKESGVSRATFYRHFCDKYDLMYAYYRSHIDSISDESNAYENILQLCDFIRENKKYFSNIAKNDGDQSFFSFFCGHSYKWIESHIVQKKKKPLNESEILAAKFYLAGIGYCLEEWIVSGCSHSSVTLATTISTNMPTNICQYFLNDKQQA
jgi:AcrR family transcriptional regulator